MKDIFPAQHPPSKWNNKWKDNKWMFWI